MWLPFKMERLAWLESILKLNKSKNSISRVINVEAEQLKSDGDYYSSVIYLITVDVILKSGERTKISLVQKKTKIPNSKMNAGHVMSPIFKREIQVYKNILERFSALMDEYEDINDEVWCKCVGFVPYTTIILENLKVQNYKMANRKDLLDLNHALLVAYSLGRFHALGHVLIKKGILSQEDFPKHFIQKDSPVVVNLFQNGIKQFAKEIEKYWPPEWKETAIRLGQQQHVLLEKVRKVFTLSDNSFLTVCHGDCWTCNILFKYCPYNDKLPVGLKFIDFQTVYINSYMFDLIHFLVTSVQPDIRYTKFNDILEMYQKSLKATLAHYKMEEDAPTMEQVQSEAKRIKYFGFVMNMIMLPMLCSADDNVFEITDLFENRSGDIFKSQLFASETCQNVLGPDIKHWLEEGVL